MNIWALDDKGKIPSGDIRPGEPQGGIAGWDRYGGYRNGGTGQPWGPSFGRFRDLARKDLVSDNLMTCPGSSEFVEWSAGGKVKQLAGERWPASLETNDADRTGVAGSYVYFSLGGIVQATDTDPQYDKRLNLEIANSNWPLLYDGLVSRGALQGDQDQGRQRNNHHTNGPTGNILYTDGHVETRSEDGWANLNTTNSSNFVGLHVPRGPDGEAVPWMHYTSYAPGTNGAEFRDRIQPSARRATAEQVRQYFSTTQVYSTR